MAQQADELEATVFQTVIGRLNRFKQPLQRAKKATIVGRLNVRFPKLFLRLRTEFQTSDFPMTLAKWFFIKSAIDSIGLAFYHHH